MVLARIWGLRGGAVAMIVDDVFEDIAVEFDPQASFQAGTDQIEPLARFGCEIVRVLAEHDGPS